MQSDEILYLVNTEAALVLWLAEVLFEAVLDGYRASLLDLNWGQCGYWLLQEMLAADHKQYSQLVAKL